MEASRLLANRRASRARGSVLEAVWAGAAAGADGADGGTLAGGAVVAGDGWPMAALLAAEIERSSDRAALLFDFRRRGRPIRETRGPIQRAALGALGAPHRIARYTGPPRRYRAPKRAPRVRSNCQNSDHVCAFLTPGRTRGGVFDNRGVHAAQVLAGPLPGLPWTNGPCCMRTPMRSLVTWGFVGVDHLQRQLGTCVLHAGKAALVGQGVATVGDA